jgi:hypothetical protein
MTKLVTALAAMAAIAVASPSISDACAACGGQGQHHYAGSYGPPMGQYGGARYGTRQGYAAGELVCCSRPACNPCPRPCDPCAGGYGGGYGGGLGSGLGLNLGLGY